jgi:hypothetical protein
MRSRDEHDETGDYLAAYAFAEEALELLVCLIEQRTWLPDRRRVFPLADVDRCIKAANALTDACASLRDHINDGTMYAGDDLKAVASQLRGLGVSDAASRREISRTIAYVQAAASQLASQADQPTR